MEEELRFILCRRAVGGTLPTELLQWFERHCASIITDRRTLNAAAVPVVRMALLAIVGYNEEAIPVALAQWLERIMIPALLGSPTETELELVRLARMALARCIERPAAEEVSKNTLE